MLIENTIENAATWQGAARARGVPVKRLIAALTASVDPESLLSRIAEQVCTFNPKADGAAVGMLTPNGSFVFASAHGLSAPALGTVVPAVGSFQELALSTRQPQVSRNVAEDSRLPEQTRRLAIEMGIGSWAVIPLFHQHRAVGALSVVATGNDVFDAADIAGLTSVSSFISALIGSQAEMAILLRDLFDEGGGTLHDSSARFAGSLLMPRETLDEGAHAELDGLLEHPRICPVFQPIVDLKSGTTVGYEGLSRFPADVTHRSTADWFAIARGLGRSLSIEAAALHAILRAARAIPQSYIISVNLSPETAVDTTLQQCLMSSDRRLMLELTEHAPYPPNTFEGLQPLRKSGILLAIDDAGAGYASLTQLLRIRPDVIKIDAELVTGLESDPARRALVSAVAVLARELNALTVAEGVENCRQLQILSDLDIRLGQGYHLGRPVDVNELQF